MLKKSLDPGILQGLGCDKKANLKIYSAKKLGHPVQRNHLGQLIEHLNINKGGQPPFVLTIVLVFVRKICCGNFNFPDCLEQILVLLLCCGSSTIGVACILACVLNSNQSGSFKCNISGACCW